MAARDVDRDNESPPKAKKLRRTLTPTNASHSSEESSTSDAVFTLLSWNIDGLDKRNTQERTEAVCDFITSHQPHAVFLQEVVPSTWTKIVGRLGDTYDCYSASNPPFRYYPAILVRKAVIEAKGDLGVVIFPTSTMGRHLLKLAVNFSGTEILLLTTHLESLKNHAAERKRQLKESFGIIETHQSTHRETSAIFGGDLNIRDNEVQSVGLPRKTVDIWQACGSNAAHQYTWDVGENDNLDWPYGNKPRSRFDRLYLSPSNGALSAKSFRLVGKERLESCGRFPSDHWGIWVELEVKA